MQSHYTTTTKNVRFKSDAKQNNFFTGSMAVNIDKPGEIKLNVLDETDYELLEPPQTAKADNLLDHNIKDSIHDTDAMSGINRTLSTNLNSTIHADSQQNPSSILKGNKSRPKSELV